MRILPVYFLHSYMISKGQLLMMLRESMGIRQQDAAAKVGISASYLSLIENGKKEPANSVLLALANLYKVPFVLLSWSEDDLKRGTTPQEKGILQQLSDIADKLLMLILSRK